MKILLALTLLALSFSFAQDYDEFDIAYACKESIKNNLKAPSTAKFPGMWDEQPEAEQTGDGGWLYITWVDAQNGFGAMIRSTWGCAVTAEGAIHVAQME